MIRSLPPVTAWSSALIAALIGFGGTVALVVQAMRAMGASVAQTGSAVTALCLGIAVTGAALSVRLRMPIVLAWSTPGAALLATSTAGASWPVAVGAFVTAGAMTVTLGAIPALERLAARIPASVASAMLAGVLLPFCIGLFLQAQTNYALVALVLAVFLIGRVRTPLYALPMALAAGLAFTLLRGEVGPMPPGDIIATLAPVLPRFEGGAILSLSLPLFLVTLVSQNLPGLVVLRSAGYAPRPGGLLVGMGFASMIAAPFGAHAVNLAAITAALCTSGDAHPEKEGRWVVGLIYAGFYLALAAFSPALVRFFLALPHGVIATLTGIALIPALSGAVDAMLADKEDRDAATLTFLATGSGLTLLGLGAAFWGLVIGFAALGIKRLLRRSPT
ncbi:MAG TPA: benzoate/H(+) symporter BenE family transporter [Sphingobium sp.]